MKHTYVRSLKEYRSPSQFEEKKILAAARRLKRKRKCPTSVALEEETIRELKQLAQWRGVPYQILMRMFILEGLRHSVVRDARPARKA
ncbi:MAG: hypothetical protein HY077_03470 [Elusimicrobia bacterium]|nr:hypothetical protein [Elusimicrobiota bacterium]